MCPSWRLCHGQMLIVAKDSQDAMWQPTFNELVVIPKLSHSLICLKHFIAPILAQLILSRQQENGFEAVYCTRPRLFLCQDRPQSPQTLVAVSECRTHPQKDARPANLPACRVILIYQLVLSKLTQPHVFLEKSKLYLLLKMSVSIYAVQINAYICRHYNQIRSLHVPNNPGGPWVVCLGVLPILRPASEFDCIFHGNSTENRPLPVDIAWLVRNAPNAATEDWENDPCALVCKKVSQAQWFFSRNILHSNVIWSHSGACLMKAWLGGFDILGSRRRSRQI